MNPRFLRLRDAPAYLGMCPQTFNEQVRPFVTTIPIGVQVLPSTDLNSTWADEYKRRSGRPGEIGEMCLVDIGPTLIDQLITKHKALENANATVNRHIGKLRAILKKAVEWQWIVSVPKVRMLKEPKNRVRWIRQAEAEGLMAELPGHLQAMAGFSLATGLRESNVTGLEWSQVDLEQRVAWIHPDQFKTENALGVPLNSDATVILRGEYGKHPRWVFTYEG